jgi:hypothetical protein
MLSQLLSLSSKVTMADNHTDHTDAPFGQIKMLLNFAARGRHSYHHNSLYNHVTTTDSFPLLDILQKVYRKQFKILLLISRSCLSLVSQSLYHILLINQSKCCLYP